MRLAGKVALISGGRAGMGAAEARLFAREGARVVIGDVLDAEGRAVEAEIRATGGEAVYVRLDVTREADWEPRWTPAVSRFGKLDVLVNNAGIGGAGPARGHHASRSGTASWTSTPRACSSAPRPRSRPCAGPAAARSSTSRRSSGWSGTDNSSPQYQASKGAVRLLTKATAHPVRARRASAPTRCIPGRS